MSKSRLRRSSSTFSGNLNAVDTRTCRNGFSAVFCFPFAIPVWYSG
ncbi:MAG: hypothetical protein LBT46_09370 [Planctomycetaceae bacterium]|nr:hypothetical protein [Planctomycetaceae bacterium]